MRNVIIFFNLILILGTNSHNMLTYDYSYNDLTEVTTEEDDSLYDPFDTHNGGFAEEGTVMVVEGKIEEDNENLWDRVRAKIAELHKIIEFVVNVIVLVGIITSIIITSVNIVKLGAITDVPTKRHQTIIDLGVCFVCISLFGAFKLLSVLIIKSVM